MRYQTNVMPGILRCAAALALASFAVGCGNSPGGSSADSPPAVQGADPQYMPGQETPGAASAPAVEGTGAEQPAPPVAQAPPAIKIASLPVGKGSNVEAGRVTCVKVSWLGTRIPDGVSVDVIGVRFDPAGLFEQAGSGCDGSLCRDSFAFTATDTTCTVPVAAQDSSGEGTLYLDGRLRCPDHLREACRAFAASPGQSTFDLLILPPEPADPSPSPSGN